MMPTTTATTTTIKHTNIHTLKQNGIEILSKNKVIRLITLYRLPTIDGKKKKEFIEEFGNYLDTINNLRTSFICGDFIRWLDKVSECNNAREFVELLEAQSLVNSVINRQRNPNT